LEAGDIVLYERDGRLFLHRLVDLRTSASGVTFTTRGDALPQNDFSVSAECLLGVLAGFRRDGAWLSIPRKMSLTSHVATALLKRSRFAVRLVLRVRLALGVWRQDDSVMGMEARSA